MLRFSLCLIRLDSLARGVFKIEAVIKILGVEGLRSRHSVAGSQRRRHPAFELRCIERGRLNGMFNTSNIYKTNFCNFFRLTNRSHCDNA